MPPTKGTRRKWRFYIDVTYASPTFMRAGVVNLRHKLEELDLDNHPEWASHIPRIQKLDVKEINGNAQANTLRQRARVRKK